jgi:hypothetical protein
MTEPTAVEVLALSALIKARPMTSAELSRCVSDMGMHLDSGAAEAVVRSLVGTGMAELTTATSLGKDRITAKGRTWLTSRTAPPASKSHDRTN